MARKYDLHEIDGVIHELHPVKVDDKKIGFVPVRVVKTIEDVAEWASDTGSGFDEGMLVAMLKHGAAIHLQRLARESVTGGKFNDAAFNKMFAILPKDQLLGFAGDAKGLRSRLKELWVDKQTELGDTDGNYIHEINR